MFNRQTLEKHSVDMRQFIDCREATLANGMRVLDVYNSSGLTLTILPDRGFDIWTAHYKGLPLTWISQGSPHPPDFAQSWVRQFNGGLLATCGLRHVGPPETDPQTGEVRDLHGLYSRLRAYNISIDRGWDEAAGTYVIEARASISEAILFGEQLRLDRTYRFVLGEPGFEMIDHVTNLGDMPTPFMKVFHFNLGYPLVREGTRLHLPVNTASRSRDEAAQAGFDHWDRYDAPQPGYAEQVFFHEIADERATILLANDDVSLQMSWNTHALPYLTQWKNVRNGIYVCGLEPGNAIPEGQNSARTQGRLQWLDPGETHISGCQIRILEGQPD